MLMAADISDRASHASLGGKTPFSKLHNTDADLSALRAIGARASVHVKMFMSSSRIRPGKVSSAATATTAKPTGTQRLHATSRREPERDIPTSTDLADSKG